MHAVSSAVVRIVIISLTIAMYSAVVSASGWGGGTDANIGAGLVGFVGLVVLSLVWALVDGRALGLKDTILSWSVIAATVAIGWWVVLAVVEADPSSSVAENLVADLSLTVFVFGLVLVPASVGALMGKASRPRDPA